MYESQTSTPFRFRSQTHVEALFAGMTMLDPGVVWLPERHPTPDDPGEFVTDPSRSSRIGGVGRIAKNDT